MALSLAEVTQISRDVVEAHERGIQVVAVASTDADTARVELLVTISGCHREPCSLMLNLTRAARSIFERELRIKLREALEAHTPTS